MIWSSSPTGLQHLRAEKSIKAKPISVGNAPEPHPKADAALSIHHLAQHRNAVAVGWYQLDMQDVTDCDLGLRIGRIIVAAFASSIHRLQIVLDIAHQINRKVCVLGRSMLKNVEHPDH